MKIGDGIGKLTIRLPFLIFSCVEIIPKKCCLVPIHLGQFIGNISKTYRKYIDNLAIIYKKYINNLAKIYRKLLQIYRQFIDIYRKYVGNLSEIFQ